VPPARPSQEQVHVQRAETPKITFLDPGDKAYVFTFG
jgi:hypothetical protein